MTWIGWVQLLLTVALTPLAAYYGARVSRRAASELESRSRREETLRHLRWAAELAVSADPRRASLGVKELDALGASDLLDEAQQSFVDAGLEAAWEPPEEALVSRPESDLQVLTDSGTIEGSEADRGGNES